MNDSGENRPGSGEAAAKPPRRRPGDKPFIPFARFEDVVVRCGHVEKFGLMPDGKDKFREGRRQKAMSRDCKACREKRQREEEEAARLRRAEKEKKKMLDGEQRRKPAPRQPTGRLP